MPSALSIIGALTIAAVGATGMYEWDRHPSFGWHAHVLFWKPGFDLPDSLAVERDKARAALQISHVATQACRAAIDSQDQAIAAQSAAGAARLADVTRQLRARSAVVESYRQDAAILRDFVPAGADACSRWESADSEIMHMMTGR